RIYSNSPANEPIVLDSYRKGIIADTVYASKYNSLVDEVGTYKKQQGRKCIEAALLSLIYDVKKQFNKTIEQRDLIGPALAYYQCGNLQKSDTIFSNYITAFPDSIYGYYWRGKIQSYFDSTMTLGLAIPFYDKTLTIAEGDKVRFKGQGIQA